MRSIVMRVGMVVLACGPIFGQVLEFEVASVKPAAPGRVDASHHRCVGCEGITLPFWAR